MTHVTTDVNSAFGLYSSEELAEKAVDALFSNGFMGSNIFVILENNETTRRFAQRKQTRIPTSLFASATAGLPLDGKDGFVDVANGPLQGALPAALREMGVPGKYWDEAGAVGKVLVSIKCDTLDVFYRAIGILMFTSASHVSWGLSPENYQRASA
jgi:hypothetical protein